MTQRPKTPRELARGMSAVKFCAKHFADRARKARTDSDRARWSKAAAHYRELAELEEQVVAIRPKPPAPSI